MDWLNLIIGFFMANILGYGGGPASIPLMYQEIVTHYHWLTDLEFANMLALGNTLPGPIATKVAAYVGYHIGGLTGMAAALIGTIVPTALALIWLMKLLKKYQQSRAVKGMTLLVQPVIAILMIVLTWQLASQSVQEIGWLHPLIIGALSFWALHIKKIHPAPVILAAFLYGGIVLGVMA
ncbi:MAG: chromate transporter [Paenibacillus sp.]|uniref:Chromate transporter n=1 Tax=Paenibacillus aquistagni TaxID=1852522 RepID=A0A1X7LFP1_9BACL|nr:chromate transporter [Paenibacillus aquistagni]MBR2570121.1 chromate transporter [Paenibacillus sp.]NMM55531.1 chromate transporter [Paenibacillus aquistagni]SMG52324.1 chromate transporter [Paenibacillus aquistagni]